jgi:hypothetical protein
MPSRTKLLRAAYGLVFSLVLATNAFGQELQISEKARAHFRAGVNLMQDPDGARYEEAYREFRAAYAESPSWKILGNLGIAAMKLERDGEAIEAFKKYLAEGGTQIEAEEKAQFERDLQTLQTSVGTVTLSSNPPGAAIIDQRDPVRGDAIVNGYGPLDGELTIGLHPGHHRIIARLSGYEDSVWEVDVRPGASDKHTFELKKPEPGTAGGGTTAGGTVTGPGGDTGATVMERPVPTAVFIGLAATGVFAIGAGVTGIMATSKKSDFEDANDGTDPAKADDLRKSGQTLNLVTDILLGGAVVAGGVTAVLYFSRPEVPAQRDAGRFRVTPLVGPNGAALSFAGQF